MAKRNNPGVAKVVERERKKLEADREAIEKLQREHRGEPPAERDAGGRFVPRPGAR